MGGTLMVLFSFRSKRCKLGGGEGSRSGVKMSMLCSQLDLMYKSKSIYALTLARKNLTNLTNAVNHSIHQCWGMTKSEYS